MSEYTGKSKRLLNSASARVGDRIKIESEGKAYEGILMPRSGLGDDRHLVLKLSNGYNIGVRVDSKTRVTLLERGSPPKLQIPKLDIEPDNSKPDVTIVGTGGTIASRVDYRTGAVFPAFTPEEIYSAVPELADIANIRVLEACNVFSEHMTPQLWLEVGRTVARELNRGARGVVVAHGTDTMGYTAAALSFMLEDLFRPVVLVGSQRSSDRPSSDAALNLISAVRVAGYSDIAEVTVVMHGSMEDDHCLVHRGTKVRKCHTSRRDAFQSVNELPLAEVRDRVRFLRSDYKRVKESGKVRVNSKLDPKVVLLKVAPGTGSEFLDAAVKADYHGIVLEGTGLGHTPQQMFNGIKQAIDSEIPVVMTSQCIWGRTNMNVYSTGRDLLKLGVIPVEDMLPETAYVKLMFVLGRTREMGKIAELMRQNFAGEISKRTRPDTYGILRGG